LIVAIAATCPGAAETKTRFENLPPAVQTDARKQTGNAAIVGATIEKEKGKTLCEVETRQHGRGRDLLFSSEGALVGAEEQTDLAAFRLLRAMPSTNGRQAATSEKWRR
jgi:hypothetical protein